jgi:hypothetical protein
LTVCDRAGQVSRPRTVVLSTGRRTCGSRRSPRSPASRDPAVPGRAPTWRSSRSTSAAPAAGPAAVLGCERLAVVAVRDPRLAAGDVFGRQIRGVAAIAERQHVGSVVPVSFATAPRASCAGSALRNTGRRLFRRHAQGRVERGDPVAVARHHTRSSVQRRRARRPATTIVNPRTAMSGPRTAHRVVPVIELPPT